MTEYQQSDYLYGKVSRSRAGPESAAAFHKILTEVDQSLGYHGHDRFVAFYHEPRALEVMWRDRYSYGFATGAWMRFMDEIAPVAAHYQVNVGCDGTAATHVLFLDRSARQVYFSERTAAVQFLGHVGKDIFPTDRDAATDAEAFKSMIEITSDEVAVFMRRHGETKTTEEFAPSGWLTSWASPGISIASAIHFP